MSKFVIIDGYSLLFRAYYATAYKGEESILKTGYGTPINAIFTFANMVLPIVNSLKIGDSICVCLDTGKKTYRHDLLSTYKGNRPPCPESLIVQMPILREFLDDFNIPHLEIEGYEADDVAGTLANRFSIENNVFLYTSDKDYLQLVNEKTSVNLLKKGMKDIEEVNINNFYELYHMTPKQIIDFKGLCGDSSDNLKGIPGIGSKTAISLIEKYGSLEDIYINIDKINGKLKENLLTYKDDGFLCKQLATINKNIDMNIDKNYLLFSGYDSIKVQRFIQKYEMKSLISKVKSIKEEIIELNKQIDIEYKNNDELHYPIEKNIGFAVNYDYEENYHTCEINGFSLFIDNSLYYLTLKEALNNDTFKSIIEDNSITKNCYDSKAVCYLLKRVGLNIKGIDLDLMLTSYLIDSNKDSSLGTTFKFYGENINLDVDSKTICLQIAKKSYLLRNKAFQQLKQEQMEDLYFKIELPLSNVLFEMENEGFPVSKRILLDFKNEFEGQISALTSKIYSLSNEKFNISSPNQVANILFNKLGLQSNKKSSTSIDYLKYIINEHPIVPLILEYRKFSKLLSTYINGLLSHIYDDNKLHSIFNQASTTTGRLSSSDPNMQNIAIRDDESKEIRKAFFFGDDRYEFLSFDYSQIELRVLASLSNCQKLIDAFNDDTDIHTLTAQNIFGKSDITPLERRKAKAVNFGIIYGISDYGLKEQINSTISEAKLIINKFYETYPEVKNFLLDCITKVEETNYAQTIFGRKRYIPSINSSEYNKREFAKRAAMNAPVQGSAADIIKIVMIKIFELLKDYDSKLILQIHDELIFKINVKEKDILIPKIKYIMENTVNLKVKLKIDGGVAKTWYDIK